MVFLIGAANHPKTPWNVAVFAFQLGVENHYTPGHGSQRQLCGDGGGKDAILAFHVWVVNCCERVTTTDGGQKWSK